MRIVNRNESISNLDCDILGLMVREGQNIDSQLLELDNKLPPALMQALQALVVSDNFKAKPGECLVLVTMGQIAAKKLILVGLGKRANTQSIRRASGNLARKCRSLEGLRQVCLSANEAGLDAGCIPLSVVQAMVEGWLLGSYSFDKYKTQKESLDRLPLDELAIVGLSIKEKAFVQATDAGRAIAEATNLSRSLIAEPAMFMTPSQLAQEALEVASTHDISCQIFEKADMEKLGMGAFLGVAQGAKQPPKFVVMNYRHPKAKKTIAIVGKGITFDSGGLSLKNPQSMETMKYDMSGAACVIGVMKATGVLKPEVSILGIFAATENMPGGQALHPGDVLVAANEKTIEVNNTDAEGRLILADALCYAVKMGPDEVIDIATLTGACVTALGTVCAGIMGSEQSLIDRLIKAGDEAGEKLWQLPLFDEYKDSLKSDIADLKNAGSGGKAGSSCAGMFLQEFVGGCPWAHLDIAGPGWFDQEKDECNKGGTGFGVRTLCHYIMKEASLS